MSGFGDYTISSFQHIPPAHDEGEKRVVGRWPAPEVDWDRAYGENGPLREEARALLAEGMSAVATARELVWRYGRQCESTGRELMAAVRERKEE
jgi:hypothetical protein